MVQAANSTNIFSWMILSWIVLAGHIFMYKPWTFPNTATKFGLPTTHFILFTVAGGAVGHLDTLSYDYALVLYVITLVMGLGHTYYFLFVKPHNYQNAFYIVVPLSILNLVMVIIGFSVDSSGWPVGLLLMFFWTCLVTYLNFKKLSSSPRPEISSEE